MNIPECFRDVSSSELQPNSLVCKHIVDDHTISIHKQIDPEADTGCVYLCNDCLIGYRMTLMQNAITATITKEKVNPNLSWCVLGRFIYSYTGSIYDEYDLVYIEECVGAKVSKVIFNEILFHHINTDKKFDNDEKIVTVGLENIKTINDEKVRVLLRKIPVPENHEFNFIKVHGNISKLKLIQMFVSDTNNKLPGEDGYTTMNPSSGITAEEYFKNKPNE